jgi:hypothetical protein
MSGVMVNADLSNVGKYIGAVGGILDAVQSPAFSGNFVSHLMGRIKVHFMTETIAAHRSGRTSLNHVFEWPDQDARGVSLRSPSDEPLFKLTSSGRAKTKMLSFVFLPSTKPVPLPDPARYGFNEEKLDYLRRHIFRYKAAVMETDQQVTIYPTEKLFIPDARVEGGYYMTSRPSTINPGGPQATGGFAQWWNMWMETRAPALVKEETELAEERIAATGRTVIRYAAGTKINGESVGGRFARGTAVSFPYVEAEQKAAELRFMEEIMSYYPEEDW